MTGLNSDSISKQVRLAQPELLEELKTLIAQPSISATGEGIEECAILVQDVMRRSGITTEILRISGAPPLVYGRVDSKSNPDKTLLFYNHYDVQPPEPLDLWDDPPFGGTIRDGKIFGRGASDDKGELMTRIKAVKSYMDVYGDVPCNILFVVEGEEEIGSVNMARYLKEYTDRLRCDGVIWEFGYVDVQDRPIISLGMKGLLYLELTCKKLATDAHSSLATIMENPAWRLIQALDGMRDANGNVTIPDWHREKRPLSDMDRQIIEESAFDADAYRSEFGIDKLLTGSDDIDAKTALATGTTCNIAGFYSGHGGAGVKTVLPASATAKVDFRLVPDMDPAKQLERLKEYLHERGFDDIQVKNLGPVAPHRTDPSNQLVDITRSAARESFGDAVLSISSAGTGPMHAFSSILEAPCISVGATYVFARIHSPNEFARLDLLEKATTCMCKIMDRFGKRPS